MRLYTLADEYTDTELERRTLAALGRDRTRFWEFHAALQGASAFRAEQQAWTEMSAAFDEEREPLLPADWEPAEDPDAAVAGLLDLCRRRQVAEAVERVSLGLRAQEMSAEDLAVLMETEAVRVQGQLRETAGVAQPASEVLKVVIDDAERRSEQRKATGKPVTGLLTGLQQLDFMLNGLMPGRQYVLAGPPGMGKTTLATSWMEKAARTGMPVIYVSYENSPASLLQKLICARAGLDTQRVERGLDDSDAARFRVAAVELTPILDYITLLEGVPQLTVQRIRGVARQAMRRHRAESCLIVIDYLQIASLGNGFEQRRESVSMMANELRQLAVHLRSPVLVLSSLNRGGYGGNGTRAGMANLKESGDVEYGADAVLLLSESDDHRVSEPDKAIELRVEKNRFGRTGIVNLVFKLATGQVAEVSRR